MKNTIITLSFLLISITGISQLNKNIGGGYFGRTVTYPGAVLEFELEQMFTEKFSLPFRVNLGFYNQPRDHAGVFLDVNYGFRRYFKNIFFLEAGLGVGILQTILNSDAVYQVDDNGNVSEASRFNKPDFMPSITLGLGFNLAKDSEKKHLLWIRPKLFWQVPHKISSTYNFALQVGYTVKIQKRNKKK